MIPSVILLFLASWFLYRRIVYGNRPQGYIGLVLLAAAVFVFVLLR